MVTRNQAIEKVVKVLRLARSAGTEHEAHAALLTAQRLMYAHAIAEHEVAAAPAAKEAILESVIERSGKRLPWSEHLAAVIAQNFRCAFLISRSRSTGAVALVFIGRHSDATVAGEAYRSAAAAGQSLADAFALTRAPPDRAEARSSYLLGFLKGLYERFQESSGALMVLTEPEIVEHATALANGGAAQGGPLLAHDAEAVEEGYASGFQYGSNTRPLQE